MPGNISFECFFIRFEQDLVAQIIGSDQTGPLVWTTWTTYLDHAQDKCALI